MRSRTSAPRRYGFGAALLVAALLALPAGGASPGQWHTIELASPPAVVNDGDTFEADLDGDGRIEVPRERVRLLYVDTPELTESHKGRDRLHGLPAKAFLADALRAGEVRLRVPAGQPTGHYGRTLAIVEAGGRNANLALIRAGHSPFDTRFGYPTEYDRYAAAEGEAFDARRGIWGDEASRSRYLARLRQEGRTPAGATNPLYVPGVQEAATLDATALMGRYARVGGTVAGRRSARRDVELLWLARPGTGDDLQAVVFPHRTALLPVGQWRPGRKVLLEGFVKRYRGRPEIVVHYGRLAD